LSPKFKEKLFYGWVIVFATIIIMIILGGARLSFTVFFKPLANEFDMSRAMTSSLNSVYMLVCASLTIVGGWAVDRYGPRFVYLIMGLFTALSLLITSQVNSWWQLYLSYSLLLAIGTASGYPVLSASISKWFEKKRGLALSIASSGFRLGQILFTPLSAFLIYRFDWRMSYLVMGLIALLIIIPTSKLMRKDPNEIGDLPDGARFKTTIPEEKSEKEGSALTGLSLSKIFKNRNYWLFMPVWVCDGFTMLLVSTHIVPYATDVNVTTVEAAIIVSLMSAVSIPASIIFGKISDNTGPKKLFIITLLLKVVAFVGLIWARELWMFYMFAVIFGISMSTGPLFAILCVDMFGTRSIGVLIAILDIAFNIGAAVGPFIGGLVYDVFHSYNVAFIISAFFSLIAVFLISLLKGEAKQNALWNKGC
jgi:MFS family permease